MDFLALYRGESVAGARLVAVCSEPEIVDVFLRELSGDSGEPENHGETEERPPLHVVHGGDE